MQVTVENPRLAAVADIVLDGGNMISVTFGKDDSELTVVAKIREQVTQLSQTSVAVGGPAIPQPSDEDLAPVLSVLRRMQGVARDVS